MSTPTDANYLHIEDGRICKPWAGDSPLPIARGAWTHPRQPAWTGGRVEICLRPHPAAPGRPQLLAIMPKRRSHAVLVHIYVPGWRPHQISGSKGKSRDRDATLCNQSASTIWHNITTGLDEPTGRRQVPMSAALAEIRDDPELRWCAQCIGTGAYRAGLLDNVARLIVEADLKEPAHA